MAEKIPGPLTNGETRTLLSAIAGIPREHVRHYALAIMDSAPEGGGLRIVFCCDDPMAAATIFAEAGIRIVSDPALQDGRS
jgi:hypothetical protein